MGLCPDGDVQLLFFSKFGLSNGIVHLCMLEIGLGHIRIRDQHAIEISVAEVDAVRAYDQAIGRYNAVPFVPDVKADLTQHVLERALKGLFLYLAQEEAAIR